MPFEATIGERIPDMRFTVDVGPMKVFSILMADPNPIHFDPEFVKGLGVGDQPVNQGTLTMSYSITAVAAWAGGIDRLQIFRCRFKGSVFAGDEVTAGAEVVSVDDADDERLATLNVWLERQTGERAVEGTAVVLLR